jgi:hypothetical protein
MAWRWLLSRLKRRPNLRCCIGIPFRCRQWAMDRKALRLPIADCLSQY